VGGPLAEQLFDRLEGFLVAGRSPCRTSAIYQVGTLGIPLSQVTRPSPRVVASKTICWPPGACACRRWSHRAPGHVNHVGGIHR
jgi:hypothetical protein